MSALRPADEAAMNLLHARGQLEVLHLALSDTRSAGVIFEAIGDESMSSFVHSVLESVRRAQKNLEAAPRGTSSGPASAQEREEEETDDDEPSNEPDRDELIGIQDAAEDARRNLELLAEAIGQRDDSLDPIAGAIRTVALSLERIEGWLDPYARRYGGELEKAAERDHLRLR